MTQHHDAPGRTRPRAYSYIRFSDSKQHRGESLRRQLRRSREYADKHDLDLDESTTLRDLAVSAFHGANRHGGAFGLFLDAVKTGRIAPGSYLLVESFDRLSRQKPTTAMIPFMELLNAGIIIVTLIDNVVHSREAYEKDWTGLIVSLAKMAQANDESEKKSDRLSDVWRTKREQQAEGTIVTSKCPGWLRRDGDRFEIVEERAAIVRRVFSEFTNEGKGREMIARGLNGDKVKPFGHGKVWHGGTVQKLTTNAAVIGHFRPHTVRQEMVTGPDGKQSLREKRIPVGEVIEGYYPAIISPDMFLRAQNLARERSVAPGNSGGRRGTIFSNLLSGLCRCIACRSTMVYRYRGPRSAVVLMCSGYRNRSCSNSQVFPYAPLEAAVLDWVKELRVEDDRGREQAESEKRIAELEMKRDMLANKARAILDAFHDGSRFAVAKVNALEKEINSVEAEIELSRQQLLRLTSSPTLEQRQVLIASLRARLASASKEEAYALRSGIAQSLREIVQVVLFQRFGAIHLVLKGAEKHYMMKLVGGTGKNGTYKVEPLTLRLVHEEMPEDMASIDEALRIKEIIGNEVMP